MVWNNAHRQRSHRFPPDVIRHAVWLYQRFIPSYRDVEKLLAERGVGVSYEAAQRQCHGNAGGCQE
ncbi:MAG: hypothetical protein O9972_02070, partial [Burkholderiales bacterium]|nr:hypothetical protein [Burkholderiales bacterium]